MILLDTNVVSEAVKPAPDPSVLQWLDAQPIETLFLSTITLAELGFGLNIMPNGRRREALSQAVDHLTRLLADQTLAFDTAAAGRYGLLAAAARTAGTAFPIPDGYIAAIAASRGMAVATRDVGPFLAAGLSVINPWD